jgi:hypothetical protein
VFNLLGLTIDAK